VLLKREYKETQIKEKLYHKYGFTGAEKILFHAQSIQINSHNWMSLDKAVKKAIKWMLFTYSREELREIGMINEEN